MQTFFSILLTCALPVLALFCLVLIYRMLRIKEHLTAQRTIYLAGVILTVIASLALWLSPAPSLFWVAVAMLAIAYLALIVARTASYRDGRCRQGCEQLNNLLCEWTNGASHYIKVLDKVMYSPVLYLRPIMSRVVWGLFLVLIILALIALVAEPSGVIRLTLSRGWDSLIAFMRDTGGTGISIVSPSVANATETATKAAPNHEILRNIGLMIAGFVGLIFALWRSWAYQRQTNVVEQGHITDRFIKASEQLGSEHVTVRIGAINSLWRIGVDSKKQDDKRAVLDVLCGFIRDYRPTTDTHGKTIGNDISEGMALEIQSDSHNSYPYSTLACPSDIQTALKFLGNRIRSLNFKRHLFEYILDLNNTHLGYSRLAGYNFIGAALNESNLRHTIAFEAHFHKAKFFRSDLGCANLEGADLSEAMLIMAGLVRANLRDANLKDANLCGAELDGAILVGSNLSGANLQVASFTDTDLGGADISGADFREARRINQMQINKTRWDGIHPPLLPEGMTIPSNYGCWEKKKRK